MSLFFDTPLDTITGTVSPASFDFRQSANLRSIGKWFSSGEAIFTASAALSDKLVPMENRAMWIGETDFVKFKLADVVMGGAQLNAEAVKRGFRGTIDGIAVITVPDAYIPSNCGFIMKYKGATVDPVKLKMLRVQKDPMGIDGDVLEGRIMYDAFVLDAMCDGVYVYKTYAGAPGSTSTVT